MSFFEQDVDLDDLRFVNRTRHETATADDERRRQAIEDALQQRFRVESRLAVYGTLAPGRSNHHVVQDVGGSWQSGLWVRGTLVEEGWGASLGFPALRWDEDGPAVAVQILESDALPAHWARLDAFEGAAYRRIVVPVYSGDREAVTVANIYEAVGG